MEETLHTEQHLLDGRALYHQLAACFIALLLQWLWLARKVRRKKENLSRPSCAIGSSYLSEHSHHIKPASDNKRELIRLFWSTSSSEGGNRPRHALFSGTTLCLRRCLATFPRWSVVSELVWLQVLRVWQYRWFFFFYLLHATFLIWKLEWKQQQIFHGVPVWFFTQVFSLNLARHRLSGCSCADTWRPTNTKIMDQNIQTLLYFPEMKQNTVYCVRLMMKCWLYFYSKVEKQAFIPPTCGKN